MCSIECCVGHGCNDSIEEFGIREEKEGGKYWNTIVPHYLGHSVTVLGNDDDETCNGPYVERKHKLEPCLTVGSESIEETGFYSNVQIEPSNEKSCRINIGLTVA